MGDTALRPWAEMDDDQKGEMVGWVVTTCRLFGASLGTAHLVAGEFARGLDGNRAWSPWRAAEARPTVEPGEDRHGE